MFNGSVTTLTEHFIVLYTVSALRFIVVWDVYL